MDQTEWDQTVGRAEDVRRVFEHVPTMLVAVAGPEYRVVANNAAHRAFAPRTVIGTSLREHFPELDGQSIFDTFDQVVATGRSRTAHEWRVQADIDGTGVLREVFFDLLISPYLDRHGSVIGVQLAIDDVTDRVRARIAAETDSRRITESYQQVQQASLVMQRALLADAVPVLPGAEIAASYLVAAENTAAGGDWFDAMTEPGGCLVMVLGDVVGHGVRAAAVMAQLRTAVRMALFAGASIDSALGAVDRFSAEIPGAASATLCVARFDTETGILEYCTAGHPPPLVITADGLAHYLDITGAGPLGSGRGFATNTAKLGIGDTVLLYSDGIIERPGVETHSSTDELAEVAARVRRGEAFPLDSRDSPLQRMCDDVIELLVRGAGYADDITLLSARRRTFPTPVHLEITADGTAERTARTALRDWLDTLGGAVDSAAPLEFGVAEFVANTAEHAYSDTHRGTVTVDADLDRHGRVHISVQDSGRWKTPVTNRNDARGRGLPFAQRLLTDTTVTHDGDGTTVTASHLLTRQAHIVTDPRATPGVPPSPARAREFDVGISADQYVVVSGDVDTAAAAVLAQTLSAQSRGGIGPLRVDLTAVTHLGSAAVSVLMEASRRAARHGSAFELVTLPGGTAHHVLSLAGMATGPH